jgi:hypothetical protein
MIRNSSSGKSGEGAVKVDLEEAKRRYVEDCYRAYLNGKQSLNWIVAIVGQNRSLEYRSWIDGIDGLGLTESQRLRADQLRSVVRATSTQP